MTCFVPLGQRTLGRNQIPVPGPAHGSSHRTFRKARVVKNAPGDLANCLRLGIAAKADSSMVAIRKLSRIVHFRGFFRAQVAMAITSPRATGPPVWNNLRKLPELAPIKGCSLLKYSQNIDEDQDRRKRFASTGKRRTRILVAAKIALATAGATGGTPDSPTPLPGSFPSGTI